MTIVLALVVDVLSIGIYPLIPKQYGYLLYPLFASENKLLAPRHCCFLTTFLTLNLTWAAPYD